MLSSLPGLIQVPRRKLGTEDVPDGKSAKPLATKPCTGLGIKA